MEMLKFSYDVIFGQSYTLVPRPYDVIVTRNPNCKVKVISGIISSIMSSKQQQCK